MDLPEANLTRWFTEEVQPHESDHYYRYSPDRLSTRNVNLTTITFSVSGKFGVNLPA